jgi:hypothetical protein
MIKQTGPINSMEMAILGRPDVRGLSKAGRP